MNQEDVQTSLELTLRYYQGDWEFQGKTRHNFDQVLLHIDGQTIDLTQKLEGTLVRHVSIANQSTAQRNYLFFESTHGCWFYLREASLETMSCGESRRKGVPDREDIVWEVPLKRKNP